MGIIQSGSGTSSGSSFTVALPAASQPSSRVVVIVAGNTIVNTPSGWTLRTSQVNEMGHYLFDRAGGGSSWTFTNSAGQITWVAVEVANGAYDKSASANNPGGSLVYATPAIAPAPGTVTVASIGSTSTAGVRTVDSWTNGFVEVADLCYSGADYPMQGVAQATGGASTQATYSLSSGGRSAIIASYVTADDPEPEPSDFPVSGLVSAATAASGSITAHLRLTGDVLASTATDGGLFANLRVAGESRVDTSASATFTANVALAGGVEVHSAVSGSLSALIVQALSGSVAAETGLSGRVAAGRALGGASRVTTEALGSIADLLVALSGTASVVTAVTGRVGVAAAFRGTVGVESSVSLILDVDMPGSTPTVRVWAVDADSRAWAVEHDDRIWVVEA